MAAFNGHDLDSDLLKEWNGFGFKFVEKSDYPKVLHHLQNNFYLDEPIHQVLGVTPERIADMDEKISDILDLGHGSFYAYPLDEPDKVAAVLILWIHEEGKSLPQREARSPLTITVREAILTLKKRYDIHEQRQVRVYPELFIISTDKLQRGKGLATAMYRKAIANFRAQGHPFVSSLFTNPLSRKIGERLGFKPVSRMEFEECKRPDDSSVFGPEGKSHFAVETVLDLK